MDKQEALKLLATHGYNVGYGAKKHFSTYDIVEKAPGAISFASIAFGILSLKYFDQELESHVAVFLTLFGVVSLYISSYLPNKDKYKDSGVKLTKIFSKIHASYLKIKSDNHDINSELKHVDELMDEFYNSSIEKQILFSDWYAHYKFFIQMQIDWIDEQNNFGIFKDKMPRSFQMVVFCITCLLFYKYAFNDLMQFVDAIGK